MAQPLPLDEEPVLEAGVVNGEAIEEIAAIERRRPLQRLRCPLAQQLLEEGNIDGYGGRVEPDGLPVSDDRRQGGRLQALAEAVQGVFQAVAGLLIPAV